MTLIILADSGATKTDWCIGNRLTDQTVIQTEGINPFHQPEEKIRDIIRLQLLPALPCPASHIRAIFFYGAGCIPPQSKIISDILKKHFPLTELHVETDLLGAARALCKDQAGIACILGTGSNSCLYDGQRIVRNIPPLGYILGDEGSGAYLGKHFLADCMKGIFPPSLYDKLLGELKETPSSILERVYRRPHANRFLSGIVPFIYKCKHLPEVHDFLNRSFCEFFRRNIVPYQCPLPVSFTGSVAWFFQDEIKETAASLNLVTGLFVKNPIGELANYHFKAIL